MSPTFHSRLLASAAIDAADARRLVEVACVLQRSAPQTRALRLRGKNIALLCVEPACASARRFDAAATALGARVAHITPAPAWLRAPAPLGAETARLLEHLYDAVDCEELPRGFAQRLHAQLGVPVYDGLAREDHAIFALLPELAASETGHDDARRALLQAALVSSMT